LSSSAPSRAGLLDTSTLILLSRLRDVAGLPEEPMITAVTLAELSVGPLVAADEKEQAARQAVLQGAESDFEPISFDANAARAFGQVAASLRRAGRKPAARAFDAMIAAIAIANDLPLYTCNPADFAPIDGLRVVAVPHPDRPLVAEPPSPRYDAGDADVVDMTQIRAAQALTPDQRLDQLAAAVRGIDDLLTTVRWVARESGKPSE
jgi:predicted nucleic acid-binding protein